MPSILLVSAVLALGGVLALAYAGDRQRLRYSLLQDSTAVPGLAPGAQQHPQHDDEKRRRQQKARQSPEVELLRGSSGESLYSS